MQRITLTDLDQQIWDEELADFVPEKIFDAHVHSYCDKSAKEPYKGWPEKQGEWPEKGGYDEIVEETKTLFPNSSASFLFISCYA